MIKNEIFADVRKQVTTAGLSGNSQQRDSGLEVVAKLLRSESKSITCHEFDEIVQDLSSREALLRPSVFSYHPSQDTITFQSQAVATYAKERLGGRQWWILRK